MTDEPTFERFDRDGLRTLAVRGEMDLAFKDAFHDEMTQLLHEAHSPVTVDLSGVTFIDSSGLRVLSSSREIGQSIDVEIVLQGPSARVLRVLQIVGLDQAFEIRDVPG